MLATLFFFAGLLGSLAIAGLYFRDLGDVPQLFIKTKRENVDRFIRNEYRFLAIGLGAWVVSAIAFVAGGAGPGWLFWVVTLLSGGLVAFTWIYVHLGLRNKQQSAEFFSIDAAREFVSPSSPVIVLEKNGVARAHPQAQLMRPHLAGTKDGLEGENVIMTFCAIANLGLGYSPEIEGDALDLEVLAQHGNNLVLRDNATGEPVQQIYGFRAKDQDPSASGAVCPLRPSLSMQPWPTFRMTFRGFQKAYPDGTVFLNTASSNPLLFLLDQAMELAFTATIQKHHLEARPIMQNLERPIDPRLPTKTYVWGVNIGDDATCWTDDFVIENGNIVNAVVGGQALTVSWHPIYESLNVWINTTGKPVREIDFFGNTPDGKLERSPDVKPGLFWHVWAEFFPHTDVNRQGDTTKTTTEVPPSATDADSPKAGGAALAGLAFALAFGTFAPDTLHAQTRDDIRLIAQITVDGLRGDLIDRYYDSFGPDGFRRLTEGGVWYRDAHHLHANTETIVGHSTLATGAHPSEHGMIGNAWYDRSSGRLVYNIEDVDHPILPTQATDGELKQIDPAQAIASAGGRSPRNLLATTFGDELDKFHNGRAKVIGISGKDRSAVSMAGHSGKAFWMSTATGAFETSAYYYDAYPAWVSEWNARKPADAALGTSWSLSAPLDSYLLAANDDRPYEADLNGFGRTFPHPYGSPEDGLYYTQVLLSPLGDEITADFAKAAVIAEGLGQDAIPDYLSVSFSGVDATNHFFGPSSLENEEMVRALDRTLADFFAFLDNEVGAEHVLYVLSADHGMAEMPEFMQARGVAATRLQPSDLTEDLNAAIARDHGVAKAIRAFFRPYVYLDHEAIADAGADARAVTRQAAEALMARDGITLAMPAVPLAEQRDHHLASHVRNNHHLQRSGDIYVVQTPYSFLMDKGAVAVMHGTPWRYDTHVPVLFAGPGIEPAQVSRPIGTIDVAATLSDLMGVGRPSAAAGAALAEVVQ